MSELELVEPIKVTEAMKGGLARMYADTDIRAYLVNAVAIANTNVLACLKANKPEEAKEYAARLDAIQKLLDKGRSCFAQAEKLRVTPLEEQVKENEHAPN